MKFPFILLISIFIFACADTKDTPENYLSTRLEDGPPPVDTKPLQNRKGIKNALLDTGIDSLKMYFGSYQQDSKTVYWAFFDNGSFKVTTFTDLEKKDSSELLSTRFHFEVVEFLNMVTVELLYNPISDEVYYTWIVDDQPHKQFTVWELSNPIKPNRPMPHFEVETLDGEMLSLNELRGKNVVINWWATNCKPCIAEMPGLNQLREKYQSNPAIEFLAIADDNRDKLEAFLAKRDFAYRQTLSNPAADSIFGDSYPKHVIINPEGIVTYYTEGGFEGMHLEIEGVLGAGI